MENRPTKLLHPDAAGIADALRVLARGGLVAFPTETVYGLGADARNGAAVADIFAAKGRPQFNPLIIHVPDLATAQTFVEFNETALILAHAFWPGPFSLVLPIKPSSGLSSLVSAGLESVAVRVPNHPLAQKLLQQFGGPVAAPSANLSGKISPTKAVHVMEGLEGHIDAVIDGGACTVGLESTIVLTCADQTVLLRAGGVTSAQIEAVLGTTITSNTTPDAPRSPGQLLSHYAPTSPIRLNVTTPASDEIYLGFGPNETDQGLNLSHSSNLSEAAANLFDYLRRLDKRALQQGKRLSVAPIPVDGIGMAINDRLTRAAH